MALLVLKMPWGSRGRLDWQALVKGFVLNSAKQWFRLRKLNQLTKTFFLLKKFYDFIDLI